MRREEVLTDCGEIRPRRSNVFYALRREANLKCLILTFFITGSTAWAVIWCGKTTKVTKVDFNAFPIATSTHVSPCDNGFSFILAAFIVMLYLLYLVECWYSKAREVISAPKVDVNSVYRKVEQMRAAKPLVWWKAISYHYVRRTKQFSHSRNGKTYTSSKVVNERVNAHASTSCFLYAHCGMRDISRDLVDLEKYPLIKVTFSKAFIFSNALAAAEFEHQRATFFQDESGYDDYIEMKEGLDLIGVSFQDSILACSAPPDRLPWFLRKPSFWLFSSVLLSWPLRILLTLKTAHVHFQVTKLFGTKMMGPDVTFPWNYYMASHQWWRREAALLASSTGTRGISSIQSASSSSSSSTTTGTNTTTTATIPTTSSYSPDKKSPEDKYVTEKSKSNSCDVGAATYIPHYYPPPLYQQQQLLRGNITHGGIPRSFTLLMPEPSSYCSGGRNNIVAKSTSVNFKETLQQTEEDSLVPSYSEALLLGDQTDHQCQGTNTNNNSNYNSEDESTPLVCGLRESPPDYIQALQTSRPVFLPPIFRLRRCQTEKRVHSGKYNARKGGRSFWLEDVQPTFLQSLKPPPPPPSSTSQVNNDTEEED